MRRIDTMTRRRIMQLYVEEQYSMDAIRSVVGCSRPSVRRILIQAGIARRQRVPPGPRPVPDAATIIARYQAGESMATIATALQHHWQTIRRVLTDAGVPIRANGGPTDQPARVPDPATTDQPARVPDPTTTDQPSAPRPTPWYAVRWETWSPCPGCGAPRCLNPFCCGRRLRALAQHRGRQEERRAA